MLEPLKLKVLIRSDGKRLQTDAGLQMVNYSLEGGLRRGTVVAVGKEVTDLKEGDRVCWQVHDGRLVEIDGEELSLLYETEVIGTLENE
jgi:co-chaperonin GroES (HSP10)